MAKTIFKSISLSHPALWLLIIPLITTCYHAKPVTVLPRADAEETRTLFIGLDGVDFTLMQELKAEGYFAEFLHPVPLISTFPSATTIGFTGIFWPLNVGKVPGYETRFYAHAENKIMGGTPLDIYEIPINYKYYFDWFRHSMQSKAVMYSFPSLASKQDLIQSKHLALTSDKNILMTYLGGTDGSAHLLGRERTKRTLIYMDKVLRELQRKHLTSRGEPLRIVLFSDHGFHYTKLKTVSNGAIKRELRRKGLRAASKIKKQNDVVLVHFGLLSAGVGFTHRDNRRRVAEAFSRVPGVDMIFWHADTDKKIHILNDKGEEAYFAFRGSPSYLYHLVNGDPLGYATLLKEKGYGVDRWLPDRVWKEISYDHEYPDAGFRLYDAFFTLVENRAGFMFSLKKNTQFGSTAALVGTFTRIGQRGTHGGLFKETSQAFVMSNFDDNKTPLRHLRYNELFPYFIPQVVKAYQKLGFHNPVAH